LKRLAIVLATRDDLPRAARLAIAARAAKIEVSLFAMDAGVAALAADPPTRARLEHEDCELVACALSAHRLALGEDEVGVLLGSQDDHAAMVSRADRVVAFT
jgi:hypothetical protein